MHTLLLIVSYGVIYPTNAVTMSEGVSKLGTIDARKLSTPSLLNGVLKQVSPVASFL